MKKYSLEEILQFTKEKGPRVVKELGTLLSIEEAEFIVSVLKKEGFKIEVYDFPGTRGVWQQSNRECIKYKHLATKQLIEKIAEEKNVDYRTFEGFKAILPLFTKENFERKPINKWGSRLGGMVASSYGNSPSSAILDLIESDNEFEEIRRHNLQPYDFSYAPRNIWVGKDGKATSIARNATKQLIRKLAEEKGVDYKTFRGFKKILPSLTKTPFENVVLNEWGTTSNGALGRAYKNSPSKAVLDLIESDNEFEEIIRHNLQPYDFKHAPSFTWKDKEGNPTSIARNATKQLIRKLAEEKGVDYKTFRGFKEVLGDLTADVFRDKKINCWGTRLDGMVASSYGNSPSSAILDLIESDNEFEEIRRHNLQPYDFSYAPRNTWGDKRGKATDNSRNATKQLIRKLAEEKGVDYKTFKGFKEVLGDLTADVFRDKKINCWGTMLRGMLLTCYRGSPSSAVLDLIKKDEDFKGLKGKITQRVLMGRSNTRKLRAEGKYSGHNLREMLKTEDFDLSDHGFYAFSKGEKQTIRELLAEEAENYFGNEEVSYFGLEGPIFSSYISFNKVLNIDVKKSLFPERDKRNFNIMKGLSRTKKLNDLLNGNSLRRLELVFGSAKDALRKTDKNFNLIFLDWLGHLAPSRINELNLGYNHLEKKGMIAATLNMNPVSENRFQRHTGFDLSQRDCIYDWAEEKQMAIEEVDYVGGDKKRTPMSLYIMKR